MNKSRLREFAPITLILGFALTLRLWRLNQPKGYIFDEIYYAKNAASLVNDWVEIKDRDAVCVPHHGRCEY